MYRRLTVALAVILVILGCGNPMKDDGKGKTPPDGVEKGREGKRGKKGKDDGPPPDDGKPPGPLTVAGRQFGTAKDDTPFGVAQFGDQVFVVGATNDRVDKACDPETDEEAFIQVFSSNDLSPTWHDTFGTPYPDVARVVAADASGVYIAGKTNGELDGDAGTGGDLFLRKYSLDGKLLVKKQIGTEKMEEVLDMFLFGGEVYLSGGTTGDLCLRLRGRGGEPCRVGKEDAFVAKFDQNLEFVAILQFGTDDFEEAPGVGADENWVYVTGATGGTFGDRKWKKTDAYVVRLTHDLKMDQVIQFGSDGVDFGRDVVAWKGDVFVTGRAEEGMPGAKGFGGSDSFIYRAPFDGKPALIDQWGTDEAEWAYAIRGDASGLYVAASTGGIGKHDCSPTDTDAQVRKYDHDLKLVWSTPVSSPKIEDEAFNVAISGNDVFLVGRTRGTMGERNLGGFDAFIAKMSKQAGKLEP